MQVIIMQAGFLPSGSPWYGSASLASLPPLLASVTVEDPDGYSPCAGMPSNRAD